MTHAEFFNSLTSEQRDTFASQEAANMIASGIVTWESIYNQLKNRK